MEASSFAGDDDGDRRPLREIAHPFGVEVLARERPGNVAVTHPCTDPPNLFGEHGDRQKAQLRNRAVADTGDRIEILGEVTANRGANSRVRERVAHVKAPRTRGRDEEQVRELGPRGPSPVRVGIEARFALIHAAGSERCAERHGFDRSVAEPPRLGPIADSLGPAAVRPGCEP